MRGKTGTLLALAALVLAVLALVATGCGGDDSSSDEAVQTESTATEETTEETTDETASESVEDESTDTETSGGGSVSDECLQLNEAALEVGKAFSTLSGNDPASVEQAAEAFQEFADKAPDAVKDDFGILADTFSGYAELLKDVDLTSGATPDAETLAKIQEFATGDGAKQAQEASARITAWSTENCAP